MDFNVKYRPRKFDDVCGNDGVKNLLIKHIEENKLPNVIIMSGLSGCGKTTLSYLAIKAMLCKNKSDGNPCDMCNECKAVNESLYASGSAAQGIGIHTFDMSLFGDEADYIKNICNVIESKIIKNRKRFILLEELHITKGVLQEKLDRVLEYIQPNVYVFICTTNLHKIVKPIQRRATILTLTVPSKEEQIKRLSFITQMESKPQSYEMLKKIVEVSGNNPAMSVRNLEMVLSAPDEGINLLFAEQEEKYNQFIDYFDAISMGIISIIEFIENKVNAPAQFLLDLQDFIYVTFKLRYYTQAVATASLRKRVRDSMTKYSDKALMNVLSILSNVGYCSDNDAKRYLLLIGYQTNPSLYETINSSDTVNSIVFRTNNNSTEAVSVEDLKSNHFGLSKFSESYDKAMGLSSEDDL